MLGSKYQSLNVKWHVADEYGTESCKDMDSVYVITGPLTAGHSLISHCIVMRNIPRAVAEHVVALHNLQVDKMPGLDTKHV